MGSPRVVPALMMAVVAFSLWTAPTWAVPPTHGGTSRPVAKNVGRERRAGPMRARTLDQTQTLDINQINMIVTNVGSFAFDAAQGSAGLEYPKGTGKTAVFAGGLWLGGQINGVTKVAVTAYSNEWFPGPILPGGLPADPTLPVHKVYKLNRVYANPADRDAALLDYNTGAVPNGADVVTVQTDGTLDILGDQMTWCVYNEADSVKKATSQEDQGHTGPIGIEIQQTAFAFNRLGPLGRTVFLKFKLINRGSNLLENAYVSLWVDPDLGEYTNDLLGCDPALSLGFCYNGDNDDAVYGFSPPAVGFDFLRGPIGSGGTALGMTSFVSNILEHSGDPASFTQVYNVMQGLTRDGLPFIDPTTGLPTTYVFSGDPVTGQGWLDVDPADRLFLTTSGPFTMAPGSSQEVVAAIVIGHSVGRLSSISDLRCADAYVQEVFDQNFAQPGTPPGDVCPQPVNCSRTADFWRQQCAGGDGFTGAQLTQIAQSINAQSTFFDWLAGSELASFCAALNPPGPSDPRNEAKAEFAALLANFCAGRLGLTEGNGRQVLLIEETRIACEGLDAGTIGALIETADLTPRLLDAFYENANPNPTALHGTGVGLPFFGGGAGTAWQLFGSALDPANGVGFHDVEIRFTGGAPGQKAYRYLRSATSPRTYLLQGFVDVPWTVWNVDDPSNPVQLNAGWLEEELIADGQWNPQVFGGRELIWPMSSTYTETPNPFYLDPARDDALNEALEIDFQYVLWPAAVDDGTGSPVPIDDGDKFHFVWGRPTGPGVDVQLIDLEGQPLGDPDVLESYMNILGCLDPINNGIGIGEVCGDPTPALASLVSATADPGRIELTWYVGGGAGSAATLYRREGQDDWAARADLEADGTGMIRFEDRDVVAGARYGYRLGLRSGAGEQLVGEVWLDVPTAFRLALAGARPNPATADLLVSFSLPTRESATLALYDIAGRLVRSRPVGSLGPGSHLVNLTEEPRLSPGVYVICLTQGARTASAKAAVVR